MASSMDSGKPSVDTISLINSIFGEDIQSLRNAKELYKHYESMRNDIQKQVNYRKS